MIFVLGYGQICNNILQFAHIYAWGKKRGVKVIATRFCYKYKFFEICRSRYYNPFTYLFAKYGSKWGLFPNILFDKEDVSDEEKARTERFRFCAIKGWYFRDYEAFLDYKEDIKAMFSFLPKITAKVNGKLPERQQGGKDTIRLGVHIRRRDYITWNEGKYYFSDNDYIRFIQSFCSLFTEKTIEIIAVGTDKKLDYNLYRKSLAPQQTYFPSGNAGEDLYALSTCDYIIGPPSTFSLIASMYNDSLLYWVFNKEEEFNKESFKKFEDLFRHII